MTDKEKADARLVLSRDVVEVVLCIEATNNMKDYFDKVKVQAKAFPEKIRETLKSKDRKPGVLRVKIITFRNYSDDSYVPSLAQTDFFTLPESVEAFYQFIDSIQLQGDCETIDNGLDALELAMDGFSDQTNMVFFEPPAEYVRHRCIILLWSASDIAAIEPQIFDELTDKWHEEGKRYGCLVLLAPDIFPWSDIGHHWVQVVHSRTKAGHETSESDWDTIAEVVTSGCSGCHRTVELRRKWG